MAQFHKALLPIGVTPLIIMKELNELYNNDESTLRHISSVDNKMFHVYFKQVNMKRQMTIFVNHIYDGVSYNYISLGGSGKHEQIIHHFLNIFGGKECNEYKHDDFVDYVQKSD